MELLEFWKELRAEVKYFCDQAVEEPDSPLVRKESDTNEQLGAE